MEGLIELQRTGIPDLASGSLDRLTPAVIGILGIFHFGPPRSGPVKLGLQGTMTGSWILLVGAGPVPTAGQSIAVENAPFSGPRAVKKATGAQNGALGSRQGTQWALVQKKTKCAAGMCVFISIWASLNEP